MRYHLEKPVRSGVQDTSSTMTLRMQAVLLKTRQEKRLRLNGEPSEDVRKLYVPDTLDG